MEFDIQMRNIEFHKVNKRFDAKIIKELEKLEGFIYKFICQSPSNSFQLESSFDQNLLNYFISQKYSPIDIDLKNCLVDIKYDFCLHMHNLRIVVEIEKANKEKILYDFLKFHVYLSCGADLAILFVPRNWAHSNGTYNLFELAMQRYNLCEAYGMAHKNIFDRILIVGFDQYFNGEKLNEKILRDMKQQVRSAHDLKMKLHGIMQNRI